MTKKYEKNKEFLIKVKMKKFFVLIITIIKIKTSLMQNKILNQTINQT